MTRITLIFTDFIRVYLCHPRNPCAIWGYRTLDEQHQNLM